MTRATGAHTAYREISGFHRTGSGALCPVVPEE